MIEKRVYWFRHGLARVNVEDIVEGEDSPLTEKGEEQAALVADRCKRLPIEMLVSSKFRRAKQTASKIKVAIGVEHVTSELFGEKRVPSCCIGLSKSDPIYAQWLSDCWERFDDEDYRCFDAEVYREIRTRIEGVLAYLIDLPVLNVGVVSHGDFSRMVAARILLGPQMTATECKRVARSLVMNNTGLSVFEYQPDPDRPWRIEAWNDKTHLG